MKLHIAFYRGTRKENPKSRFVDNLICFCTDSKFSHAELVLNYNPDTKSGFCLSSSERDGGVRSKYMTLEPERWHIIEIITEKTYQQITEFFEEQNGKKYDYFGAVGVVLPFVKGTPEKWFCFEVVGSSLGYKESSYFNADNLMERAMLNASNVSV